jgi:hypothetical protein
MDGIVIMHPDAMALVPEIPQSLSTVHSVELQLPATMICPGSFNDTAVEDNHWESLCPTGTMRRAFRVGRGFEQRQAGVAFPCFARC